MNGIIYGMVFGLFIAYVVIAIKLSSFKDKLNDIELKCSSDKQEICRCIGLHQAMQREIEEINRRQDLMITMFFSKNNSKAKK